MRPEGNATADQTELQPRSSGAVWVNGINFKQFISKTNKRFYRFVVTKQLSRELQLKHFNWNETRFALRWTQLGWFRLIH